MKCLLIRTRLSLLLLLGVLFFPLFIGGDAMAEGVWAFENDIDTMTSYQDGIMLKEGNQLWFWNPDQPEPQMMGIHFFSGYRRCSRTKTGNCWHWGEAAETLSFFVAC